MTQVQPESRRLRAEHDHRVCHCQGPLDVCCSPVHDRADAIFDAVHRHWIAISEVDDMIADGRCPPWPE